MVKSAFEQIQTGVDALGIPVGSPSQQEQPAGAPPVVVWQFPDTETRDMAGRVFGGLNAPGTQLRYRGVRSKFIHALRVRNKHDQSYIDGLRQLLRLYSNAPANAALGTANDGLPAPANTRSMSSDNIVGASTFSRAHFAIQTLTLLYRYSTATYLGSSMKAPSVPNGWSPTQISLKSILRQHRTWPNAR